LYKKYIALECRFTSHAQKPYAYLSIIRQRRTAEGIVSRIGCFIDPFYELISIPEINVSATSYCGINV